MRYTDRDCWAALIRLAGQLQTSGVDMGVSLPKPRRKGDQWAELRTFAEDIGVPVRTWNETDEERHALMLEQRPGCYGGGVRPVQYRDGSSGHYTPAWWRCSAGLGPGAMNREAFCMIVCAAEETVRELRAVQREDKPGKVRV